MADPDNIPQQAQQLTEDLNSKDDSTQNKASADMAKTNFDAEYKEAKENNSGAGTQSSDPNPVNRQEGAAGTAGSGSDTGNAGLSKEASQVDDVNSPGNSDPDDYLDMAKEVAKGKAS